MARPPSWQRPNAAHPHEPTARVGLLETRVFERADTLPSMSPRRVREALQRDDPPSRAELQGWVDETGLGLRLVPPGPPYEASVNEGRVPTREGSWHDTFNVLAFLAWPRAKRALHARVAALQVMRRQRGGEPSRRQAPAPRSREEDALTLLDETALVVLADAEAALAFDEARRGAAWGEVTALVEAKRLQIRWFGHALLEHLVLGRAPVGAGVVVLRDAGSGAAGPVREGEGAAGIVAAAAQEPGPTADAQLARLIEAGLFDAPRFGPTVPWPHPEVLGWVGLGSPP